MRVSDDVMYGQRRISIYDQIDEIQVHNNNDETEVYDDLVDRWVLSNEDALTLSADQPAQQAERRSKWVICCLKIYKRLLFDI